jgi:hypothetical protein
MKTIGPHLFEPKPDGIYRSSIGSLFPRHQLLITDPPVHSLQRARFMDWFTEVQTSAGHPPPNPNKLSWEASESVDLIFRPGGVVLIRPQLERLDLAVAGDQMLQTIWEVPRHRIRFSSVRDARVRQALRERGELWRMTAPPTDPERMNEAIAHSRVAIGEGVIYYYNAGTGTRFVTFAEFARLGVLEDSALARQLEEIALYCVQRNWHGHPEIGFFAVEALRFGAPNFAGRQFLKPTPGEMRSSYVALREQFRAGVLSGFEKDNPQAEGWRKQMQATIASEEGDDAVTETLQGLKTAPSIRWLPGGHFEEGEFVFAPVFGPKNEPPSDPELQPLWDPLARGFIANFIREYGNLEYLNLGRIEPAPGTPSSGRGRRGVYLAEIKVRDELNPRVLFLRVLRWGLRERLEDKNEHGEPQDLVTALFQTEEYVDYILDRRLGCLQLGMNLPPRVHLRRVTELYSGNREEYQGRYFPVIYFERDFVPGVATNALDPLKLTDARYASLLARLLGKAAAPNLIVGRSRDPQAKGKLGEVLFDDGDEIIVESSAGQPRDLVLVDHSGAFADWQTASLQAFAHAYAAPVNRRLTLVPEPKAFAEAYLAAFREEFVRLQADYARRRGAFDGLFKHLPYHAGGNFACRWEHVLRRLEQTECDPLCSAIRQHITVLS